MPSSRSHRSRAPCSPVRALRAPPARGTGPPGVVDPRSGDVQFSFDLPSRHEGVLAALRTDLRRPVTIENDVNLAAIAERAYGSAAAADESRGGAFLDELANRISCGVTSVNIVLDPGLVVLSGSLGRAGGRPLATRIERIVGRISPTRPTVAVTEVEGNPVLRGALYAALQKARDEVFSAGGTS